MRFGCVRVSQLPSLPSLGSDVRGAGSQELAPFAFYAEQLTHQRVVAAIRLLYFAAYFIGLATFITLCGVFLSYTIVTLVRFLTGF